MLFSAHQIKIILAQAEDRAEDEAQKANQQRHCIIGLRKNTNTFKDILSHVHKPQRKKCNFSAETEHVIVDCCDKSFHRYKYFEIKTLFIQAREGNAFIPEIQQAEGGSDESKIKGLDIDNHDNH